MGRCSTTSGLGLPRAGRHHTAREPYRHSRESAPARLWQATHVVIGQNGLLPRGKLSHLSPRAARAWGFRLTAHLHGRIKPTSLSLTRIVSGFFVRPAVRVGGVTLRRETSCASSSCYSAWSSLHRRSPTPRHPRRLRSPASSATPRAPCCRASRWKRRARRSSKKCAPSSPTATASTASSICRAGVYTVTFPLTGFTTVRREGIELSGAFTAPVNVELRVGALEETITVTGESPIVDVQSSRRQQVVDRDTINAIPTARAYHSLVTLVPGITTSTNDVGGLSGPATVTFTIHGGPGNEGRLQVDGMGVGSTLNGGGVSYYSADIGNAAGDRLHDLGRPRRGGSRRPGDEHRAAHRRQHDSRHLLLRTVRPKGCSATTSRRNCVTPGCDCRTEMTKIWDVNGAFGGPISEGLPVVLPDVAAIRATASTSPTCSTTGTPATRRSGPTSRTRSGRSTTARGRTRPCA